METHNLLYTNPSMLIFQLWELSLRDVRLTDAGLYECQLTTHPPTSLFFTLKVVGKDYSFCLIFRQTAFL